MNGTRPHVAIIIGRGRSGSTFLEHALAARMGATLLGETRLWPQCFVAEHTCTCGEAKTACPFWKPVIESLEDRRASERAFRRMQTRSFLAAVVLPRRLLRWAFANELHHLGEFYETVARIHGPRLFLDGSKNAVFAYALASTGKIEVTFLHLVRHPLGVVYSWERQRTTVSSSPLHRLRKSNLRVALEWVGSNLAAELAKVRGGVAHRTIDYAAMQDDLPSLVEWLQARSTDSVTSPEHAERHAMSGNPSQASKSPTFVVDDSWRTELGLTGRLVGAVVAGPLYWLRYRPTRHHRP